MDTNAFVGMIYEKTEKEKKVIVKTPCSGNKRQTCGGPWRISIYIQANQVIVRGNVTKMVYAKEEDVDVKEDTQEMALTLVP
ncbi:Hypothetical predicted protein, partial [Mytilus galloprovincialis]